MIKWPCRQKKRAGAQEEATWSAQLDLIIGEISYSTNPDATRKNGRTRRTRIRRFWEISIREYVVRGLLGRGKLLIRHCLAPPRGRDYSEVTLGIRGLIGALLLVVVASAPLAADERDDAKNQVQFGIRVAQLGLWREAIAHWERAIKLDPTYAPAYNNLAIGYEQQGDFEKARNAYEKALELSPNNTYIKQNYELFKEINDRTNKQDGQ